jgi:DNA polymerase III epsilon subunit-like protein
VENLLIIDLETQGLDPAVHKIVEIGCVLWSVRHTCVVAAWSDLVAQETNEAQPINRISPEATRLGLPHAAAIVRLRNFVSRADVLVAHRAEFDAGFLPADLGRPWVCSKFDIPWPSSKIGESLVFVALAHGVPVTRNHRALSDCLLLAHTFEAVERSGVSVSDLMALAMRPKSRFVVAARGFDEARNKLARDNGFQFDRGKKVWHRTMARDDVEALPFDVVEEL